MALYGTLTGDTASFRDLVVRAKRLTMGSSLAAELNVLANSLNRLAKRSRLTRDYSLTGLREALASIVAHFSVYRTYIGRKGASETDRAIIAAAVERARRVATTPDLSIYDFLRAVLTTDAVADRTPGLTADAIVAIARKVQQYTSPVTAKSVEDTAFYRWVPLIGLNEVGNEPDHFSLGVDGFHAAQAERRASWPQSMVATATHDHKRGEDVRARLAVLSEMPTQWRRHVQKWWRLNARKVTDLDDGPAPSPTDAYLFYQTLVAIWPPGLSPDDGGALSSLAERLTGAMEKSGREAKLRTSWAVTNEAYEDGVRRFVAACLDPKRASAFLRSVAEFAATISPAAAINGLAQTALKFTIPGVPDTYQGTEIWDFSLVDPDNRRPVDYDFLASALKADAGLSSFEPLCRAWPDGRIKQALAARLLAARRDDPDLFAEGSYEPLTLADIPAGAAVAFARVMDDRALVVAVPRLAAKRIANADSLGVDWGDARFDPDAALPGARSARCLLTGAAVNLQEPLTLARLARHPPILALRLER
jgi:(1->4)-alpha-D-glucan 1-alpha-D-glucosylmutase